MNSPRTRLDLLASSALAIVVVASANAQTSQPKLNRYGNPAQVAAAPTTPEITVRDLQIRLYAFAADSMGGRQTGRIGNMKGTNFIAAEAKRLGLVPAGDNGTYFQVLPYHFHQFTDHSRLTIDGTPLVWVRDWVAAPGTRTPRAITSVNVIFGGVTGDTANQISASDANGKFVVLLPAPPAAAGAGRGGFGGGGRGGRGGFGAVSRFAGALAVATVDLDPLSGADRAAIAAPQAASASTVGGRGGRGGRGVATPPPDSLTILHRQIDDLSPQAPIRITRETAARLFRRASIDGLTTGAKGGVVSASLDYLELPSEYARNVVAILPGSDPVLKNEYVAIGAHNDAIGITTPADHDSVRAFNEARNRMLLANDMVALTADQLASIRVNMDSIRKLYPKPRIDSVINGADDDGSGSMAVLEIAEFLKNAPVKPKRSVLFVWHTGEEGGLVGSNFFVHNPTVPLDSVVAQLNMDMIGRGRAEDIPGGGPDYLGVVGSFFDSKDLGETVAAVNQKQPTPFKLDYRFDSTVTWSGYNNIYGRSDHYNYALQGVPIAFFSTGLHGDYHQRTDEPEFIDYPHYAKIANYVRDVLVEVANGPRPRINGTRPAKPVAPVVP